MSNPFVINFYSNPVRNIGTPLFADLRLYDKTKHIAGAQCEINYRGRSLGTCEIKSVVVFNYEGERCINETTAWLSFNKPLDQVKKLLGQYYSPLQPDSRFAFITLEWVIRDIKYQESLLKDWWQHERESFGHTPQSAFSF